MKKTQVYLVKPAGSLCNMRCKYCFYEEEAGSRQDPNKRIMTPETMEMLICKTLEAAGEDGSIQFSFQGGEPTMAGLEWFEMFVKTARSKNLHGIPISWSIQTNGLSLDHRWAAFLKKNHFLVGISLDGNKAIHDFLRPDAAGKNTFTRVSANIQMLQKMNVDVNLLCVVTHFAARKPVQVYQALKKTGVSFLQFIPCLDPPADVKKPLPWSLTSEEYENFLLTILRLWKEDTEKGNFVSVRMLEDLAALLQGYPAGNCAAAGTCGAYIVVESDGTLYPCDFYCRDAWRLGSLRQGLNDPAVLARQSEFIQSSASKPLPCAECQWRSVCNGGCPRDWIKDENGQFVNKYCSAYQHFFEKAVPILCRMIYAGLP